MKTKIVSLLLCVGLLFACNNTQKGAGIGAGGGAVLGGIIGAIAGNTAVGAVIGGAVGAFMLKIAKNGNMIRAVICRFCQGRYAIFFLCFFLLLNSVLQSILRHRSALQISASRASL